MNFNGKYSIRQTSQPGDLRQVQTGNADGRFIEIVTGFDIAKDRFSVHIYITPQGGEREKVQAGDIYGADVRTAFQEGWKFLDSYLGS